MVFVMLTGCFGHTSTPMQWDVVGGAILRRVEESCSPSSNLSAPPYDIGPLDSRMLMIPLASGARIMFELPGIE